MNIAQLVNPNKYTFHEFQKSIYREYMYQAVIVHKRKNKSKYVPFGKINRKIYRDMTGLNLYPKMVTNDKKTREKWRRMHMGRIPHRYSSLWFEKKYLYS